MISDKILYKVAYLYYIEGLTQNEIAQKLNFSRNKIMTFLKKGKGKGIIEIKVNPVNEDLADLEIKLAKKYNLKECIIVDSSGNLEYLYKEMASELSLLLEKYVQNDYIIGITYGKTIRKIINEIQLDSINKNNIKVVPLMGGTGITDSIKYNSNIIASQLSEKIRGTSYIIHAPAISDSIDIKKKLESSPPVKLVYDLINKMNIAIVTVGSIDADDAIVRSGEIGIKEYNDLKNLGIVGEICFNFLDKSGNNIITEISKKIISASLESIKNTNIKILLSFSEKKINIILSVLYAKLIDIFITDKDTASLLIKNNFN